MRTGSKRTIAWHGSAAFLVLTTVGLAGCVGAPLTASLSQASATSAQSTLTAAASATSAQSTPTAAASATSAQSTLTAAASSTPTPGPTSEPTSAVDLEKVKPAPSVTWKSINWVALPELAPVEAPSHAPDPSGGQAGGWKAFDIFGWSGGFVGLWTAGHYWYGDPNSTPPWPVDTWIGASYSPDGIHWHTGQTPAAYERQNMDEVTVAEGPGGLLAVGWLEECGARSAVRLWTSTDGTTWQPLDVKKAFGTTHVFEISASSSGYVAVGDGGAAWVSADARSWRAVDLGQSGSSGSKIDSGAAFSGGFVLAGTESGISGCIPPTLRTPAVWLSPDGAHWTQEHLPGADALAYPYGSYSVCRITDRALLVRGGSWDSAGHDSSAAWTSTDGKTWKPANELVDLRGQLATDGRHGLLVNFSGGPVSIQEFGEDLELVTLTQTGNVPVVPPTSNNGGNDTQTWSLAVGPTGVMVAHGEQLWIGIPSAE